MTSRSPSLLTHPCSVHFVEPVPLPPSSFICFRSPFFSLVKLPWLPFLLFLSFLVPSSLLHPLLSPLLVYLSHTHPPPPSSRRPPPSPPILASRRPLAKVSAGHIKAHKSLVCGRTLNHQAEVVYKSDFKLVCDYPGTWRDTGVAERVRDKAAPAWPAEPREPLWDASPVS